MPRNKTQGAKQEAVLDTISNQRTRNAWGKGLRENMPPEPVSPPSSPPPLPPKTPFSEMKRILFERKRTSVEAGLVPLPDDEEGDSPTPPPPCPGFEKIQDTKDLPIEEHDPVVREWDMYMNVCPDKHVMVLRYPEKWPGQLYSAKSGQKPLEMRIKPIHKLVEVDIPIDPYNASFDRVRGIAYGQAMRKSAILKELGGSHGVAGGFGLGGSTRARGKVRAGPSVDTKDPTIEALLQDYENAVKNGHVMNKMTLGGHINVWDETCPNMFVGAFRGPNVFFTKVNAICTLRPQLFHLDALNEQKKSTLRAQPGADTEETEAVSVNVKIKKTEGETMESAGDAGEIAKLLKSMRAEPWQRLSWVDSEEDEAYDMFHRKFMIVNKKLAEQPQLACNMTNEQWLDIISCPRIDPINPKKRYMPTRSGDDDLSSTDSEGEYEYEYYTDSEDQSSAEGHGEEEEDAEDGEGVGIDEDVEDDENVDHGGNAKEKDSGGETTKASHVEGDWETDDEGGSGNGDISDGRV